jgi:hypothetical protein
MQFDYDGKDLPKPEEWSMGMNNYQLKIKGVDFNDLTYEQYKILENLTSS